MRLHRNAKTTPASRRDLVRRIEVEGEPVTKVASELRISRRTVYKWPGRHREAGGLRDEAAPCHNGHTARL